MSNRDLVHKLYLYNCSHFYAAFFNNVNIENSRYFYFCPCFYKKFIEGRIEDKSCIYECKKELCYCCLKYLKFIKKRQVSQNDIGTISKN